ncbi:Membrane peptidase [Actinidia chinensis var. chinensis]|uniref:Membrane peptidase n=1 Tax=Actinidia chinensis var. chinensis TaxID=1590841 RepID=A0A2R6QIX5_ACTCC|nr:Membrane peptidase [Actinidia chinensis var. chinensis]
MLSSYSLSQRPTVLPPLSRIRVSNRHRNSLPIDRTFRVSQSLQASSIKLSNRKWKILCFRQEEFPSGDPNPEHVEDNLCEELVRPELDKPKAKTRDWISSLQEVADAVLSAIGKPWTVPWTADTILQVTLLWIATFWFVGSWMIPFVAHMLGFSKDSLTYRGQALYSLLTDATEGLAGIVILYRCLSRFRPLSSDWFRFSLKGNWLFDVVLGCLMFPLVNRLAQFNLDLLPLLPSTPVTLSNVEQSIVARDPVAMALYTLVVSVCAPVWEEIVFRGFLLPSLTKYMPVWCSILVSSVAFALAHFNIQRMLPLIFLGVVMGVIFARSRNLLPSMLLHSLWNGFVFLDLMK